MTEVVPPVLAGPLTTIGGYGVVGAVAVVFLVTGLYAFKRLFDRVLDKNDEAVTAALAKMDRLDASVLAFREDVVSELRETRHVIEETASVLSGGGRKPG